METVPSRIAFSYKTVRVTKSRIDKGLLAIPVSLTDYFPKEKGTVQVFLGTGDRMSRKVYTPYRSTSGECRIGGMREFFSGNNIQDGDEIVVQFLGDNKYRIVAEDKFRQSLLAAEASLDESSNEDEASRKIAVIAQITNLGVKDVVLSEYYRLSGAKPGVRGRKVASLRTSRESVAPSIRRLLAEVYGGRCQVTGFGFLTKQGDPYFETHHVKPDVGDHLKNVLVVCPNVHAQFTYATVEEVFDEGGWLRRVKFGDVEHQVLHAIDRVPQFTKEVHSHDDT